MKSIVSLSAIGSLVIMLCLAACEQKQARPAPPPVKLSTLLASLPRDAFVTRLDTIPIGSRIPGVAVDSFSLKLSHSANNFLLCFRNGSYINLEKCLPGLSRGNQHSIVMAAMAPDTMTLVNTRTMSYIQFVADSTFGNIYINWVGDTAQVSYVEIFCGTEAEVLDYSL